MGVSDKYHFDWLTRALDNKSLIDRLKDNFSDKRKKWLFMDLGKLRKIV